MNSLELAALQEPLSNEARVIYCVYLRANINAKTNTVTINNKDILKLLNSHSPRVSLGREISALFKELQQVGLVALQTNVANSADKSIEFESNFDRSLNKLKVSLPLFEAMPSPFVSSSIQTLDDNEAHEQHSKMHLNWRPDDSLFSQLCQLIGVIDAYFDADELGEFIAYWLGRPEVVQTPYQWTQKFVLHLKQRRIRKPANSSQTKVGPQWVEPTAGIEFDDNVKQLIKKYSEQ